MKAMRFALAAVLWIGLFGTTRAATHYVVTNGAGGDFPGRVAVASNIQDAIGKATVASDVCVLTNNITLTNGITPQNSNTNYLKWKELPFVETAPEPTLTAEEQSRGFMIFSRPITEIVYPNTRPLTDERINELTAFATPGEYEPLNFALYPVKDVKNLAVSVSSLKSSAGEMESAAIDLRFIRYYDIRYPHYTSKDTFRRVPELLEKAGRNSFPKGECQRYWLTVRVPANTARGLYKGSVTISADGIAPVVVPLNLRVLGFTLKKDPNKHYSAYHYDFIRKEKSTMSAMLPEIAANNNRINAISENEYCVMTDYGIDIPPAGYMKYDYKNDALYYDPPGSLNMMKKSGLLNAPFMMVCLDSAAAALFKKYTGEQAKKHYSVKQKPSPEYYNKFTELIKKFELERKANGWPVFIYNPLDEVAFEAREFGSKTYAAVKAAGVPTFITKDPCAGDADDYRPYVDYWVGQPFSVNYAEVIKDKQHRYWSYPNHVACERRVPEIMCEGGRMTYGYGLWRSGYEGLVPWIWRWDLDNPFDYRDGRFADCGNKLGPDGAVIPAVYWECFREGIDDARYIYTLQQAIVERKAPRQGIKGAKSLRKVWDIIAGRKAFQDAPRRSAVMEGEELLQKVWDMIVPQTKYLGRGTWASEDFNNLRWEIAVATDKLLRFPKIADAAAPSALVKNTGGGKSETKSVLETAKARNNLEVFDLGGADFSLWKNMTGEGKIEITDKKKQDGHKCMKWTVKMDYSSDEGEKGYPIGWPRLKVEFNEGSMDFTKYDYFAFRYLIESDRDEVADDFTPLHLEVGVTNKLLVDGKDIFAATEERAWHQALIPIRELMADALQGTPQDWKDIRFMQLWLREKEYKDKTTLVFYFDDMQLARLKAPMIVSLETTDILLPAAKLFFTFNLAGDLLSAPNEYEIVATLSDAKNTLISRTAFDAAGTRKAALDVSKVEAAGTYIFKMELVNRRKETISDLTRAIRAIDGPQRYRAIGEKSN